MEDPSFMKPFLIRRQQSTYSLTPQLQTVTEVISTTSGFSYKWTSSWWSQQQIMFLELIPIMLAAETSAHDLQNKFVVFFTDNLNLVKQSCKNKF